MYDSNEEDLKSVAQRRTDLVQEIRGKRSDIDPLKGFAAFMLVGVAILALAYVLSAWFGISIQDYN